MFPNPIQNELNIEFDNYYESPFSLSIYNNLGQKVYEDNYILNNNIKVEVNNFSVGSYYFQISNSKQIIVTDKFIILK